MLFFTRGAAHYIGHSVTVRVRVRVGLALGLELWSG